MSQTPYLTSGLITQGALPAPGSSTELVLRLFSRGEAFDSEGFVEFFTEACVYQFGNLPICYDKATMLESSRWFFRNVTAVYHDIKAIWEINECVMVEMDVWYWRLDGSLVSLPCSDIFRVDGSKFRELRIFMDVDPVFNPKPVPADASVWFVGPGSRLPESGLMRTFFAEHPEGRQRAASGRAPKWSIADPPRWPISSTPAQSEPSTSGPLVARVNSMVEDLRAENWERLQGYCTPDMLFKVGAASVRYGPQAAADFLRTFFQDVKPDQRTIRGSWQSGDTVIVELDAHYRRLRDGQILTVPCTEVYRFSGDRIREWRVYPDSAELAGSATGRSWLT
jgi:limonene-1,2-epoxide hydrolase